MTEKGKEAKPERAFRLRTFLVPSIGAALFYLINFGVMGGAVVILGSDRIYSYYGVVLFIIAVLMSVCFYLMARFIDNNNYGRHKLFRYKPTVSGIFSAIVIGLGILGFSFFYMSAAIELSNHFPLIESSLSEYLDMMGFVDRLNTLQFIFSSMATVLLVPIAEELLFRGIILHEFLRAMRPWAAILFSSIIFALMHYQPVQVGYAFACGVIIGMTYYFSRSIYLSIVIHMVFNFFGGPFYRIFENMDDILSAKFLLETVAFFTMAIALLYIRKEGKERALSGEPV